MAVLTMTTCERCGTKFAARNSRQKYCSPDCRKEPPKAAEAPQREYAITDLSNPMLAFGPSVMSCGILKTDDGPRLIFTVRTPSTTVTVGLDEKDAMRWIAELAKKVQEMQQVEEGSGEAQED